MTMELPPLEALVERARQADAPAEVAASAMSRRTVWLGWAASVMLALGAGWSAQALWLRGSASSSAPSVSEPLVAAAPASSTTSDAAPTGVSVQPTIDAAEPRTAQRAPKPARAEEPVGSVTRLADTDAPAAKAPVQIASTPTPTDAAGQRIIGESVPPVDPALVSGKVVVEAPPTVTESNTTSSAERPTEGVRPAPARAERVGQERAASSAVSRPTAAGVGIQRARGENTRDVPNLFVQQGRGGKQDRQSPPKVTNEADVEEALDLIVPTLPVLRVEWAEVAPGERGLRVTQRLASGDTLEIRFVRSGGAAADAATKPLEALESATLPEGWSQVVQVHGDGWIVARAKLSRTELEQLVQGVGAGRR
jgi:hypothetical protein